MKYVLMAGTSYEPPRQLTKINGEVLIERTIRLLQKNGVEDICVTSMDPRFDKYNRMAYDSSGLWVNCFPPIDGSACYIMADVYFSPKAIKKIVETETDSIEFFASGEPFADNYPKRWAEPFAFKVVDNDSFRAAVEKTKELYAQGYLRRCLAWELWQVIKNTELNHIEQNYTLINDYSCDIDYPEDADQWLF